MADQTSMPARRAALALVWGLLVFCAWGSSAAWAHEEPGDHGVDRPSDFDVDIAQIAARAELTDFEMGISSASGLPTTWCGTERTTDNTANATFNAALPQFKVIYAYPADRPNRSAQWADLLQANASLIDQFVSAQTDSTRAPRFDLGTGCGTDYLDIQTVALPSSRATYVQNMTAVRTAVAQRVNASPGGLRNYLVVADTLSGSGISGQGEMYAGSTGSTRPDSGNIHNNGGLTSVLWVPDVALPNATATPGWQPTMMLHEMTHNMGAVQWTAPHTSQPSGGTNYTYSHCWDGYDVMCYQDGPSMRHAYVTTSCAAGTGAMWQTYDCGQDDYFDPTPASGSYLAASWNVYSNVFLAECSTLPSGACVTAAAPAAAPQNTTSPSISGTAARGRTLSAAVGDWSPVGTNYTYQWQRNSGSGWVSISGATAREYVPATADVAATVRVQVTAINIAGSASATSAATGTVAASPPANDVLPTITGTPRRLERLTAGTGTWSPAGASFTYQWQRDAGSGFVSIAGATSASYSLGPSDTGATIRVRVTARNVDGSTSADSAATAEVDPLPPRNITLPAIAGAERRGSQLSVTGGSWTPAGATLTFRWQRDSGSGFADISGATAATYTLVAADIGARIHAIVTATNIDGATSATSAPTGAIATAPPVSLVVPVVSGARRSGTTLSTSAGSWTPSGATVTYQWQRDTGTGFADISGATAATYTLAAADVGAKVRVSATATNADGTGTAVSVPGDTVVETPVNTGLPTITGTLQDANDLTADPGDWTPSGSSPTFRFEWMRCPAGATAVTTSCAVVAATTSATYRLVASDVGRPMAVRVVATVAGAAGTATSALTADVTGRALTNTAAPLVTGTAQVQETLRVSTGTWSVPTTSIGYQWRRCDADGTSNCADIAGARGAAYVPVAADAGKTLVARVLATSPGRSTTADSAATAVVAALPVPVASVAPVITGTALRLNGLRVTSGTWSGHPTTYTYQWRRCDASGANCADIPAATGAGYTLALADVDATVTVVVSARNASGIGTATPAVSGVVGSVEPVNRSLPTIGGTKQVGKTLTAAPGAWSGGRDTRYTYVWQRCDSAGASCTAITGATTTSYRAVIADQDARLRVAVTATNPDGAATVSSDATVALAPAPPATTALPRLTGTPTVGQTLTATAGTWMNPTTSRTLRFHRCTTSCAVVGTAGATTYALTSADAGAKIRVSEVAIGPAGTVTAWSATMLGPVRSSSSSFATLSVGSSATLVSGGGQSVGVASVSGSALRAKAATVTPVVTLRASARLRGRWKAWACPVQAPGAEFVPCTKAVTLRAGRKARLTAPAGKRLQVVAVRR
ncbi:MAG: hypothetical protein JHC95_17345 [Solirubrobacteraceae bacterium]|nr:hypothetical protein [Solirubrobacteraceae bacterium]